MIDRRAFQHSSLKSNMTIAAAIRNQVRFFCNYSKPGSNRIRPSRAAIRTPWSDAKPEEFIIISSRHRNMNNVERPHLHPLRLTDYFFRFQYVRFTDNFADENVKVPVETYARIL